MICSYGQFTTLWDRLGGSYRKPNDELFKKETKMSKDEWNRQQKEMEKVVEEVEGKDDRVYLPDATEKKSQWTYTGVDSACTYWWDGDRKLDYSDLKRLELCKPGQEEMKFLAV